MSRDQAIGILFIVVITICDHLDNVLVIVFRLKNGPERIGRKVGVPVCLVRGPAQRLCSYFRPSTNSVLVVAVVLRKGLLQKGEPDVIVGAHLGEV